MTRNSRLKHDRRPDRAGPRKCGGRVFFCPGHGLARRLLGRPPLIERFQTQIPDQKLTGSGGLPSFNACLKSPATVPFTSFSEFNKDQGGDVWFAFDESRPLAAFAGVRANWTSVRKVKKGETTNDFYASLTTEPNDVVGAVHPKAMPVILTTPEEIEAWIPEHEVVCLKTKSRF